LTGRRVSGGEGEGWKWVEEGEGGERRELGSNGALRAAPVSLAPAPKVAFRFGAEALEDSGHEESLEKEGR
jgi:hypothetical protein